MEDTNTNTNTILYDKNDFKFVHVKQNNYRLNFSIKNENILLDRIIDFGLIQLIYDLNHDIYEKVHIEKQNDDQAIVTIILKHFFEDIGFPQKYACLHMIRIVESETITFKGTTSYINKPTDISKDIELLEIEDIIGVCDILNPHTISFSFNISFRNNINIPNFIEKMIGLILNKIFKRVKEFIEKIIV